MHQPWSTIETIESPPRRRRIRLLSRRLHFLCSSATPRNPSSAIPQSPPVRHPRLVDEPTGKLSEHRLVHCPTRMHRTTTRHPLAIVASSLRTKTTCLFVFPSFDPPRCPQLLHALIVRSLDRALLIARMHRRMRRPTLLGRSRYQCSCHTMQASGKICSQRVHSRRLSRNPCTQTRTRCLLRRSRGVGVDWQLRRVRLTVTARSAGSILVSFHVIPHNAAASWVLCSKSPHVGLLTMRTRTKMKTKTGRKTRRRRTPLSMSRKKNLTNRSETSLCKGLLRNSLPKLNVRLRQSRS